MNVKIRCLVPFFFASISFLSSVALGAEGGSAKNREQRYVSAQVKMAGISSGLEIAALIGAHRAYGLSIEIDNFYVTGAGVLGPFVRGYFGNSFFTQGTLGYAEKFEMAGSRGKGVGGHFLLGHEWSLDSGIVIGADWISASLGYVRTAGSTKREIFILPSFPKLRFGFSF